MSASERLQLMTSVMSDVSKPVVVADSIRITKKSSLHTPSLTVLPSVIMEETDPLEQALVSMGAEERISIISYARELAPEVMDTAKFVDLILEIKRVDEGERKNINQHTKFFIDLSMSLFDKIEIFKAIAAINSQHRDSILNQAKLLLSRDMNAAERIRLIHKIESINAEDRESFVVQHQGFFGRDVSLSVDDINAFLIIAEEERPELIAYVKEFIPSSAKSTDRIELLKTIIGLKANKHHVLACTKEVESGIHNTSEIINFINILSKIESDEKRTKAINVIKGLRSSSSSLSSFLRGFSNADLIKTISEASF